MTEEELAQARSWEGRSVAVEAVLDPWPAAALTAALGRDDPPGPGAPLPPFWHHLYHLPVVGAEETGPDGHPRKGGFLPPVPLPRRMWAGGRLTFERPLRIGQRVRKELTIKAVTPKSGRQGPLVFVVVEHVLIGPDGLAVTEEHDIVYREATVGAPASTAAPPTGPWRQRWQPDPVLLFRYSALTYNGHRIHYDQPYATEVEGYLGLVVHGPLLATLLLDLLRRACPDRLVTSFAFRALAPLTAGAPLEAQGVPRPDGTGAELWIAGSDGALAMRAEAGLASIG